MAKKYYLANGETGEATGLKLLVDGKLKRDFDDISDLDLQTMTIDPAKAKEVLQEYNDKVVLRDNFFDVEYPFKKTEVKSAPTIFQCSNEELMKLFNSLRHFAELRSHQKKNGQKVNIEDSKEVNDFIRSILYRMIESNNKNFCNSSCLIGKEIKDRISEKMYSMTHSRTQDIISSMLYSTKVNGMLHNYTQLRLLFIEYANYISRYSYYYSRNLLNAFDSYHFTDLKPYDEWQERQMSVEDYFGDTQTKK